MNLDEFKNLPFQYVTGITTDRDARRLYRNNEHGLQMEVHTKRKMRGDIYSGWKDGVTTYYMDGDTREFDSVEALYEAWSSNDIAAKRRERDTK